MKFLVIRTLAFFLITHSLAALQVDPVMGNDANDGIAAPVRTIACAITLAGPGDTVHLAPGTYYESVNLSNKHGQPGKPITVDGHGAVIDGSEPLPAEGWESVGAGLFRKVGLMPSMPEATLSRWYFIWDGHMNRMNRVSKGFRAPLLPVADLQPGQWTYVQAEDAFYLKLPEGQTLETANIRYPLRGNGVIFSRTGSHLVVRNLTCTHVHNDGYNIHGDQKDLVFENIAAIECGDDGFSAHETGECRIDGFTSIGNATGMCDIGESITHFKNVFISGCLGHDVFFIGSTAHSIENALIESSALSSVTIGQGLPPTVNAPCQATFKNVLVRRQAGLRGDLRVNANSRLEAFNCTFIGLQTVAAENATLILTNSVVSDIEVASGGANKAALESLRKN